MRILLAEDDIDLGNVLSQFLVMNGYEVDLATDGNMAIELFGNSNPDLCILDVMMPGPDGFEVARRIRKTKNEIPVVFLTAKNQKEDKLTGLKLGADDYITKPFEVEELLLRIKNILLRTKKIEPLRIEVSELVLSMKDLRLTTQLNTYQLTQKEADLLLHLMQNKNEIVSRELILTKYWGENDYFLGRSLDVFISRLRKFLKDDKSVELKTIRGVGYILEV